MTKGTLTASLIQRLTEIVCCSGVRELWRYWREARVLHKGEEVLQHELRAGRHGFGHHLERKQCADAGREASHDLGQRES